MDKQIGNDKIIWHNEGDRLIIKSEATELPIIICFVAKTKEGEGRDVEYVYERTKEKVFH